jgi:hypothetical protein
VAGIYRGVFFRKGARQMGGGRRSASGASSPTRRVAPPAYRELARTALEHRSVRGWLLRFFRCRAVNYRRDMEELEALVRSHSRGRRNVQVKVKARKWPYVRSYNPLWNEALLSA